MWWHMWYFYIWIIKDIEEAAQHKDVCVNDVWRREGQWSSFKNFCQDWRFAVSDTTPTCSQAEWLSKKFSFWRVKGHTKTGSRNNHSEIMQPNAKFYIYESRMLVTLEKVETISMDAVTWKVDCGNDRNPGNSGLPNGYWVLKWQIWLLAVKGAGG